MSGETHSIKCPCCQAVLIVERRTGKILEHRAPLRADSSGDRFDDAMRNVRERHDTIAAKVADAKAREADKSRRLDSLFKDGLQRAKEEGPVEKPFNPLDQD